MLEIRYDINTKVLSAWCADEASFGNLDRGRENEATAIIDSGIPDKPPMAWLFDKEKLTANPAYKEPVPVKSLADRVVDLETDVEQLKVKT